MHPIRAAFALALVATACTTSTSMPTVSDAGDADVGASGPQNNWTCLGKVKIPPPEGATSSVTFNATDTRGKPVANVDVRACPDREDPTCANATASTKTDADGNAVITVSLGSGGFNGYFEAVETGDSPNLHFVGNPIWLANATHQRVEWRAAELKLLMDTIGVSVDPAKGTILFQTQDCNSRSLPTDPLAPNGLAAGVSLSLEPMPAGVSLGYAVPTPTFHISLQATATVAGNGGGGFINVPPGVYTITGKLEKTGERVGSQRVHVRAGAMSLVILAPTP